MFAAILCGDCCGAAIVYFERFIRHRKDVLCFTNEICFLALSRPIDVGAFVFFNRIVGKLSVFEVFLGGSLVVV